MTILLKMAMFLLGMYMAMRMIAALFCIVDLWYTVKTAYPRMIRRVLVWGIATIAITLILGEVLRTSFLWGMALFSFLYVMGWPLNWLQGRRSFRSRV